MPGSRPSRSEVAACQDGCVGDLIRPGLKVLPEPLTTEEYGMAIRKDTPELTKAVNDAIAKLKADGTYNAIVAKWFPPAK